MAAFLGLVPVFLVTTNVRWVINAPALYSYGFDRYDIADFTGIDRVELLDAARQIRDYFNNDQELLDVRVVVSGVRRSLYNDREVLHMSDVKSLVQGVYWTQLAAGAYAVAFTAVGLALVGKAFWTRLARYVSLGGMVTVGLVLLVGLLALVGFDRLFLAFHLVSFSNDLWQLDPSQDYLIAMFPQGFFFDATMLIALSTVAEAAVLALVAPTLLRWKPWRRLRSAQVLAAPADGPTA